MVIFLLVSLKYSSTVSGEGLELVMKAAVLREIGKGLTIEEVRLDAPKQGEVRVGIEASGICQSDISTVLGHAINPLPVILGHEGAGTVLEVGPGVTSVKPGDKVMLSWAPDCGECLYCRTGHQNLCSAYAPRALDGGLLDGTSRLSDSAGNKIFHYSFLSTFATEVVVSDRSCIPILGDIPMTVACLIGCAVMTGYGAAVKSGQVQAGDTVLVLGGGGVGTNAIQGARIAGASKIIVADVVAEKEAVAHKYGATHFINLTEQNALEVCLDLTGGLGADVVIEASGVTSSLNSAFGLARRGGRVVFVGVAPTDATIDLIAPRMTREEKTLTGSYYGSAIPAIDFQKVVDQYVAGKLLLDDQVDTVYPLEQINEAIERRPTTGVRNVISFV